MPRSLLFGHVLLLALLLAVCAVDRAAYRAVLTLLLMLAWAVLHDDYTRWVRRDTFEACARRLRVHRRYLAKKVQHHDTD